MAVIIVDDGDLDSQKPRSAALCRQLDRAGIRYELVREHLEYPILTPDSTDSETDALAETVANRVRYHFEAFHRAGERVGFVIDCQWGGREDFGERVLKKLLAAPAPPSKPIPAGAKVAVLSIHATKPDLQSRYRSLGQVGPVEMDFFNRLIDGIDAIAEFLEDCR